jgi:hypothetical protein
MKIEGGCYCKGVRYRAEGAPIMRATYSLNCCPWCPARVDGSSSPAADIGLASSSVCADGAVLLVRKNMSHHAMA